MEIFVLMCLAAGLLSTNAFSNYRSRILWEQRIIQQYKPRWVYGQNHLRRTPNMWLLPVSFLPEGIWVSYNLPDEHCTPCPEPFTCEKMVEPDPFNFDIKRPLFNHKYWNERFFCGIKQKIPWKMDDIPLKDESTLPLKKVSADEGGSCGKGSCYSVCYHKSQQSPNCMEGYAFHSEGHDHCRGDDFYPYSYSSYWEVDRESPYSAKEIARLKGGQCCKTFSEQCSNVDWYSARRPYFECWSSEYNGKCKTEGFVFDYIWIALEYCDETKRRFYCCCNHECYWTECQTEEEITERESKYIQENYCQEDASTKICEVANGYASFYDLFVECSMEYEDNRFDTDLTGRSRSDGRSMPCGQGINSFAIFMNTCISPKYLDTCQLLGFRKNSFSSESTNSDLGLNAAGLQALTTNKPDPYEELSRQLEEERREREQLQSIASSNKMGNIVGDCQTLECLLHGHNPNNLSSLGGLSG